MDPRRESGRAAPTGRDEDDDSVVSDRCWEERYRGDSRKWLIRDASRQKYGPWTCSATKEDYQFPFPLEGEETIGARRKMMLKKMYLETADEIVESKNKSPSIEEYCTEYDGNYRHGGWVKQPQDNTELHLKHPLYHSNAVTIWTERLKTAPKGMVNNSGMTKIIDIDNPFRKNYNFSKPPSENYHDVDT